MERRKNGLVGAGVLVLLCLACDLTATSDTNEEATETTDTPDAGGRNVRRRDAGVGESTSSSSSSSATSSSSSSGGSGSSSGGASSSSSGAAAASSSSAPSTSSAAAASSSSAAGSSSSAAVASSSSASSSASSSSSSSSSSSGAPPPELIYVHTTDRLFVMDAATRALTDLGAFSFTDTNGAALADQGMLDIAVKSTGELFGVTADYRQATVTYHLCRINVVSMDARRVGPVHKFFNALTYASADTVSWSEEALLAIGGSPTATQNSDVEILNENTGEYRLLLNLDPWDGELSVSGDVVAIDGVGIYATAYDADGVEWLVSVDGYDGAATKLPSPLGVTQVWGLAYWAGTLYGFTGGGDGPTPQARILTINMQTGVATQVAVSDGNSFFGAAVTPFAPTTP
ncbi:MAG: hypothetical protein AB2A00_43185 [Myxococcota bacterium]